MLRPISARHPSKAQNRKTNSTVRISMVIMELFRFARPSLTICNGRLLTLVSVAVAQAPRPKHCEGSLS